MACTFVVSFTLGVWCLGYLVYGGMWQASLLAGIVGNCLELCLPAPPRLWVASPLDDLCQCLHKSALHLAPTAKSGSHKTVLCM